MSGLTHINDDYIIIFRLKTHGNRFELLCRREEVNRFLTNDRRLLLSVVDDDAVLAKILQKPTIFFHAKKKEIATQSSLQSAFGENATVREIILQILSKGDIVETQRDRDASKHNVEETRDQVIKMLTQMLLNPFSGVAPEEFEIKDAINAVLSKWKPMAGVPLVVEAGYVASQIAHKIDCVRVPKKIVFTYAKDSPKPQIAAWHDFLIGYATVVTSFDTQTVPAPKKLANVASTAATATAEPLTDSYEAQTFLVRETLLVDAALLTANDPIWQRFCNTFAIPEHGIEEVNISEEEIKQFSATLYDAPSAVNIFEPSQAQGSSGAGSSGRYNHDTDVPHEIASQNAAKQREIYNAKPDSLASMVLNRQVGEAEVVFKGNKKGGNKKNDSSDDESGTTKGGKAKKGKKSSSLANGEDAEAEFVKKTHKELQDLCKKKGMSTGGKKEDLIDRLVSYDENWK